MGIEDERGRKKSTERVEEGGWVLEREERDSQHQHTLI